MKQFIPVFILKEVFFLYLLFLLKEKVNKSSRKKQTLRSFFRANAL